MSCLCLVLLMCGGAPRRQIVGGAPVSPQARALDPDTVVGRRHFTRGYPARNGDGSVSAVIEIPSGTTAKFEVADSGALRWARDRDDGSRREVDYLAYPSNYGMVPRTLSEDGDPIDIVVLGRAIERGRVARTRLIGVIEMVQDGVRDDKLVAVALDPDLRSGFSRLGDIAELDRHYPASRQILALWFTNYWGRSGARIVAWGDANRAVALLERARTGFSSPARSARLSAAGPRPRAWLPSAGPAP